MPERWTLEEMLILAARGLGKVDTLGPRGTTLVTMEEIEAMAATLALFGLAGIRPGDPDPDTSIVHFEEHGS